MEQIWRDLHYSARMILKRRGFAAIAITTLALGIGANTAIFSLVRGVLLRPLPFSEPERLIGIRESKVGEGHNNPMAFRTFAEIRDKAQTIESIAAYVNSNPTIEQTEGTVSVQGARVSHSYFKVLGVHPILGRDFTPEDNKLGAPLTAILSYELWQQLYGGDREIVGKSVKIDAQSVTIIGVMGPISVGGQIGWRSLWLPLRTNEARQLNNAGRWVQASARLKPGVTIEQARAELANLMEGVKQAYPATHTRELGIRLALGAQTSDMLTLVAVQGMKLAFIGVALGLLGSFVLTRLMKSLLFGVDTTDPVTFSLIPLLLVVVSLIACYIPARRATRVDPLVALRSE